MLKSLETIDLRVNKQSDNADDIAKFLDENDTIEKVNYPFLKNFPQFDIAKKQMKKGGNIISFAIKGDKAKSFKVLNKLKIFDISNNLGDTKSLITHPATTTHRVLEKDERQKLGITDNLVRISVGLENVDDLKQDLEQALKN